MALIAVPNAGSTFTSASYIDVPNGIMTLAGPSTNYTINGPLYVDWGLNVGDTATVNLNNAAVMNINSTGGDARYTTINPIARRNAINVPTGFNPTSISLTLGHDASNATFQTMLGISRALTQVAFKMALSGGAVTYGYGYMIVSELPSLNVNQANQVTCALTLSGRAISYSS